MAITNAFKLTALQGIHSLTTDNLKLALYTEAADLSVNTTSYTSTNEIAGIGYTAGGTDVLNVSVTLDSNVAVVDFDDPVWVNATISARKALLYNSSKENIAIAFFDFGTLQESTGSNFTVQVPSATSSTAVVRIK